MKPSTKMPVKVYLAMRRGHTGADLHSLAVLLFTREVAWGDSLPYLLGSALGGSLAGLWGKKIPTRWLHRGLGVLILWGGIRYLWQAF